MNKYIFAAMCAVFSIASANAAFAQTQTKELTQAGPKGDSAKAPLIYSFVEQMPTPTFNMNEYLGANLKYPEKAKRKNVQGRVVIQFAIYEDGSINDASVLKRIGSGCDEEALRVIKAMPAWKPGKQNGKPVKVRYTQPITFALG